MRDDVSDKLVHLTKGAGMDTTKHREEALHTLLKILKEKILIGGTGYIQGKHKCVCFSEAPIGKLSHILAVNDIKRYKYQPYGVIVDKHWLYKMGGRPVIYGPKADYELLPDEMKHRHVSFDLRENEVDFTWEREWRIKKESLKISPEVVTIIVPDRVAKETIEDFVEDAWHYIVLSDLGVKVDPL